MPHGTGSAPAPGDPVQITYVYRPDDFPPEAAPGHQQTAAAYARLAAQHDFELHFIPVNDLLPMCVGAPRLMHEGIDLLATRRCVQVDEFSWDPQASHYLKAVARTVRASNSVLLNDSLGGHDHLVADKLAILQYAASLGIPVPASLAVPYGRYSRRALSAVAEHLSGGPYIVKPREMGMGFGVTKVQTFEQLSAMFDTIAQCGTCYLVQPFLPNSGDLRVFVVNGEPVTGLIRVPRAGNYRANVSKGGAWNPLPSIPREVTSMSVQIVRALNASCLALDWLITDSGPVLSEWQGGLGGFDELPEPARGLVGDAYFRWVRQCFASGG